MGRLFFKYVGLNIIGMIGLSCYILADTFFVAKALGTEGLAALNFAIVVYALMNGVALMVGVGGATVFSIEKGKGGDKNRTFVQSFILGAIFAVAFIITGLFFSGDISYLLGADKTTFEYTDIYIKTILLFSPFFILNNIIISFVRNDDNPQLSMYAMLASSFFNIILDYVFMFVFSMGMFGAVVATSLSPIISLMILSIHFIRKKNSFSFCKCQVKIPVFGSIMSLGFSSFIGELASSISLTAFNLILVKFYGNTSLAAYGIIVNVAFVATSIFTGVAQGTQPLASSCFGRKEYKNLSKILKYALVTSFSIATVIYIAVYIFNRSIVGVFSNDDQLRHLAENGIRLYFVGFFFSGVNIVVTAFFSAVSKSRTAMAVSILRSCVVPIPAVIFMSYILKLNGIWLSYPVAELFVFVFMIVIALRYITSMKNINEEYRLKYKLK